MRIGVRASMLSLVAAGAVGLWAALMVPKAAAPEQPRVPVQVAIAAPAPSAGEIRTTGTLLFKREITLSFKVSGIVKGFNVDAGDAAKAGDVLARLDPTDVGARSRDTQATLDNAEANLKRTEDLFKKGFASQAKVDEAKMQVERARAARDSSAFDSAKAELRAPGDGIVLARLVETNEVIAPGAPILLFGDASGGLVLMTPVSDTQITRIRGGDSATVRFAGVPAPIKATVARLAAKADQRTGAFDVELRLTEVAPGLRSGLVGEARIVPSVKDRFSTYLAIPVIALLEGRGDQAAVFIVDKAGNAQRRSVRVGGFLDDLVLIAEGLARGDRVVTSGAPYLRNGQPVTIVSDQPQS
ncbi:MAG: efflux RND transporter periplasmic adaptor subunit [Alphaproteobacteria bacterium]|nr:efflux RND transporter periplasmic adaptor subunit [Alphaproteobacteria bacterium]